MRSKFRLGDLCEFHRGASVPRARMSADGDLIYIHYGDLYKGFSIKIDVENPQKSLPFISKQEPIKQHQWLEDQDIVYVLTSETVEDLGHSFLFNNPEQRPAVAGTETTIVRVVRRDLLLPAYLNYVMHSPRFCALLRQYVKGMKVFRVHPDDVARIEIEAPSLMDQQAVVDTLDALYEKEMLSNRLNDYLLELATALFEHALDKSHTEVSLGDIVDLEDSKRIPLNSRDRAQRKGPYPYYGATAIMDYVDDYLFDGIRILLGEDGTVISDDGKPILQYVWGKYWVNNHAHILKASSIYSLEAIYIALSRTAIKHIVTGAVQMKISQRNLKNLRLTMPSPDEISNLNDLFEMYRQNVEENKARAALRDSILPKLMSGEIDVSQVEVPMQPNNHLSVD